MTDSVRLCARVFVLVAFCRLNFQEARMVEVFHLITAKQTFSTNVYKFV